MTRQSPWLVSSRSSFIRPLPLVSSASRPTPFAPPSAVSALPVAESATAATSLVSVMVANDVQSFRDVFRALFVPGIAILTFGLPLLLAGILVQKVAGPQTSKATPGQRKATVPPPSTPTPLPPLSNVLLGKLLASILIDLIGDGSLLVPGLGDTSDFFWAPVSALLVRLLYGSNVLAAVNLLEELLPFTDAIPTATIGFVLDFFFRKTEAEDAAQQPQQRQDGRRRADIGNVVDVKATVIKDDDEKKRRR